MAAPYDPDPRFQQYANPHMLVSTQWLADHLDDPDMVVVESDEDVLLYDTGHIPGAVKVDWHMDLNDPVTRDYLDGEAFARLMTERGISRETTVVPSLVLMSVWGGAGNTIVIFLAALQGVPRHLLDAVKINNNN